MASQAFSDLSERLKDIDQVMAAHSAKAGGKAGRKYEVEALNRAGVVLLTAHLEGFVEDLADEAIALLHKNSVRMIDLPERLRAAQLESSIMQPIQQNDFRKANERVRLIAPVMAKLWNPGAVADKSSVVAGVVTRQMGNPGTKEIDNLFWYFDIDNIMTDISWKKAGANQVGKNINELVGKRNAIAHGTTKVKILKSDVERYIKYVKGVAKAIDEKMAVKLTEILKRPPW